MKISQRIVNKTLKSVNNTYFAQTNKAFIKSLEDELKILGVKSESMLNLNTQRLNYLKFSCDQNTLWKIMLHSRLIEGLKMQKIDYENYLPMKNSLDFKMPVIKAYSYSSNLYHEKMLENILSTTLNKLAYAMNDQMEEVKDKLKLNETEEEIIRKLEKRKQLKELPRIDLIIQKDKGLILLNLLSKPLHMHGYKNQLNWGSLRETYACAILYESKILERFSDTDKLLLWDPFCGCGTILIELFLLVTERHIRPLEDFAKETFTNLPFHKRKEFSEFLEEQRREVRERNIHFRKPETDIKLIGSDIDVKSIDALVKNSVKADLNSYKVKVGDHSTNLKENEPSINMSINPTIFHEKINNVFDTFIGDFEVIGKEVLFNEKLSQFSKRKFTIFSNVPYGTSHQMSDKIQIKSLYKRFGKFLRKHSHLIDDVFILVNKRVDHDELNFKTLSEIRWKTICTFDNNGIEVELLKFQRDSEDS